MQLSTIPLTSILPHQAGDTQCGAYCLAYYNWLNGTGDPSPFVQTAESEFNFQKSAQLKGQIQDIFDHVRFQEEAIPALPQGYEDLAEMLADFSSPISIMRELLVRGLGPQFYKGDLADGLVNPILASHGYPDGPLAAQANAAARIHADALPLDHMGYMISLWGLPNETTGAFIPYHYVLLKHEEGVLYVIDPAAGKVQPISPDPTVAGAVTFEEAVDGMQYGHAGFVF
ncbi:hypothetical protein [Allofournierella sp.]|uniref:hypothetical protein n=1 Tax=Allofournierella sp. TaxID=1940256 RepID=UPI003AB4B7DA